MRELAVGALFQNDHAQAEVVVRVVDGGHLLRAVTSEVPDEGEAVGQRLRGSSPAAWLQPRKDRGEAKHQGQKKGEEPHKRQNV